MQYVRLLHLEGVCKLQLSLIPDNGRFRGIFNEVCPCGERNRSSKKYRVYGSFIKTSNYLKYPRASEEHVPLSSHQGAASAFSGRLLVDTNLDTSSPDTYRPPPAPIPFNVTSGATQTPPVAQEIVGDKNNASLHSTNSNSIQEPVAGDNHGTSDKLEELKESDCKVQTNLDLDSAKDSEIELPKLGEPTKLAEEEDACPICLEEYDAENPKLITKCDHHFHLACILEWMERSETCPVCDQEVVFNPPIE